MEILSKLNWVDVLIVILIVRTSYVSLHDGLSHEILPLIGSIFMLIVPIHYYKGIASFLYNIGFAIPIDILNLSIFILSVVCVGVIFRFLKIIIDKIINVSWYPLIERFGGLLAGIIRGAILASIVLMIIVLIPLSYLQWSVRDRSLMGVHFLRIGPSIYEKTSALLPNLKKEEPAVSK